MSSWNSFDISVENIKNEHKINPWNYKISHGETPTFQMRIFRLSIAVNVQLALKAVGGILLIDQFSLIKSEHWEPNMIFY